MNFSRMENCFFFTKRWHDFSRKKTLMLFSNCSFFQFDRPLTKCSHGSRRAVRFVFFADIWSMSVGQEKKNRGFVGGGGGGIFLNVDNFEKI